ncbi:MAG: hypothetical protein ACI97A_001962 [Planctomycetota bacterium]|jgi:hypothetical protein
MLGAGLSDVQQEKLAEKLGELVSRRHLRLLF